LPTLDTILGSRSFYPPIWYGISNRLLFPGLSPYAYLKALFATRAQIIQWREKDLSRDENARYVKEGVRLARLSGKLFLVNSDVELALESGADGVHLTSSQNVSSVSEVVGSQSTRRLLVGQSVHSADGAHISQRLGSDYLLLGPVFDPLSKKAYTTPLGLTTLQQVVQDSSIPVFALGGLDESRVEEVLGAGVVGVAGISWIRHEIEAIVGRNSL